MAPPSAYEPPGQGLDVPYEDMHPFLQAFRDEHEADVLGASYLEQAGYPGSTGFVLSGRHQLGDAQGRCRE